MDTIFQVLTLVAFLATTIQSADHDTFKNCSRIAFCSALRDQTPNETSQFSAIISELKESDNVAIIPLRNSNEEALNLHISLLSDGIVRVKVLEENHSRYELSDVLANEPTVLPFRTVNLVNTRLILLPQDESSNYWVMVTNGPPFTVEFYYKETVRAVLYGDRLVMENTDSSQAFAFGVEFNAASKLYGLHHHAYKLALGETADKSSDPFRLRNSDTAAYEVDSPMALYGSVPAIYGHSVNWTSGIFLHNAAEEWVDISYTESNPSAYFMVESGTLDLFVMLGPSPKEVVRQFTSLTGVAHLPQIWTLGYHQCRWSYYTQEDVQTVIALMDSNNFPMDAIWLDIDYTDGKKYFTWNPVNFSDPIAMQNNISSTNRKLVTILDPHIKIDSNYSVYTGAQSKYFVKWENGSDFEGTCWPGLSSYIDFLNPEARNYYASWYAYDKFNGSTETLAGVWNDMNEPSVFDDSLEKTLPFETLHYGDVRHRDVHNIYGFLQTKATHQGLMQRDNGTKRPFILTRSHFAGSQRYAAMWTGDNTADWSYLAVSYSECMLANILGMVFCGADIGGFFNNPDNELLQRWYQAGIWLPFYRGHAEETTPRREVYLFPKDVQAVIRSALRLRYKHIPVWYTLFYEHTRNGDPIVRPLFYDYPEYLEYDDHILVGSNILARPVLKANVSQVTTSFPGTESTYWYRVDNGSWVVHNGGTEENLDVDIETSPLFYRGGSIIARKETERSSTTDMLDDPYTLFVNLDHSNSAEGTLYIDDFTSFEYSEKESYLYLNFTFHLQNNGIYIQQIDGNSEGIIAYIREVVIHEISGTSRRHTVTSDGTSLNSIDLAKQLNTRSEGLILHL